MSYTKRGDRNMGEASTSVRIEPTQPDSGTARPSDGDAAGFKNFHRSLCDRFGYSHDPVDWRRDQVSLEEWIAAQLIAAQARIVELEAQLKYSDQCDAEVLEAQGDKERAEAAADRLRKDAERWRLLLTETDAMPCRYPCLRDDLGDWLSNHGIDHDEVWPVIEPTQVAKGEAKA